MPGLPPGALAVLEEAGGSFSERPIAAARIGKLTAMEVRWGLKGAARAARPDQIGAALYQPGHGEPLAIFAAEDLERLAGLLSRTEIDDEGGAG